MRIFIHRGERTFGPYRLEDVKYELGNGSLKPEDMATYDEHTQRIPLSSVPGVAEMATPRRMAVVRTEGTPTQQPVHRFKLGCCGWIALAGVAFLVFIIIFGLVQDATEPDLHIKGDTGTITMSVPWTYTSGLVGGLIADRVYAVATKHTDLNRIVVDLEFNPVLLSDKYGHEVQGPLHMGTVTVNDLAEVRRYEFDGAYTIEAKYGFADQVSRMNYAENLRK